MTLIGVALDSPTVAEFHDALAAIRSVCRREIDQIERTQENGLALYDYEVRCEL